MEKERKRKHRLILFVIAVVMCLSACTPNGRVVYSLGGTWETDGNSITLLSAKTADSYTTPDAAVYSAGGGKTFILIECKAELAEGWEISNDSSLLPVGYENRYTLHCAPIQLEDGGEANYLLVICVLKSVFTGNFADYRMELTIQKSGAEKRIQTFELI